MRHVLPLKITIMSGLIATLIGSWSLAAAADSIDQRATDILSKMTLEQKVGQMIQAEIKHVTPADIRKYGLGSVLNGGGSFPNNDKNASVDDWLSLADEYHQASLQTSKRSAGIPIIWGTDAVHGHNNVIGATLFPHNIGLGAANDPALMRKIGEITAKEVAVTGIDWVFAPTVAVVKDDRWGRTYEGYSDRADIIVPYSTAMVQGLQGEAESFLDDSHVIATAKHFIGDGGTIKGIDQGNNLDAEGALLKEHGQGYEAAIAANVQTIMASFNSWHGEKLHGHRYLMTDVLRDKMGFQGFVISDWNGHGQVAGCNNQSCAQSVNAGVDMFMAPEDWKALANNTVQQVKDGIIPLARIDEAVLRILKVKLAAGLFDKPKPSERALAGKQELLGHPSHRAVAREAVRKSLVMLKNNQQLLPLNPKLKVLVAGDGAHNFEKQTGGWTVSWQGRGNSFEDFPGGTTIYQGIEAAVNKAGGKAVLSVDGSFDEKPDVAIVVYGEDPYAEGQGDIRTLSYQHGDKTDLALLKKLKQANIPVVSLFLTGRPLWMNAEINASDAFVVAWLPGSEGNGVADVLFKTPDGDVAYDFAGKLSFDWPNAEVNADNADWPVADVLFEYGYGLSYAQHQAVAEDLNEKPIKKLDSVDQILFKGGPRSPWKLYIGDESNWRQEVSGNSGATPFKELHVSSIDRLVQEDSRLAEWSGRGKRPSQLYLQSDRAIDLSDALAQDGALLMTLRVDKKPLSDVKLRMDCGWPCHGQLDIAHILKAVPENQWFRVAIKLSCFSKSGADLTKVNSPFLISTTKALSLAIAEVSVVAKAPKSAVIDCG